MALRISGHLHPALTSLLTPSQLLLEVPELEWAVGGLQPPSLSVGWEGLRLETVLWAWAALERKNLSPNWLAISGSENTQHTGQCQAPEGPSSGPAQRPPVPEDVCEPDCAMFVWVLGMQTLEQYPPCAQSGWPQEAWGARGYT